ncbi:MAG TPA: NAD(P)H-dependent glycerol-3-phosphate dehydrogenase [Clostridia bacterium]|nr:NAD(P)H-dependent glycerol-3-phosphate dehydrogenase [Clostridia bacterium]
MKRIGVVGAGSWGTALAVQACRQNKNVIMWSRTKDNADLLNYDKENKKYLPGVMFPENLIVSSDLEQVISSSDIILIVVPSHAVRKIIREIKPYIDKEKIIVSAAKGIENDTLLRMSEVIKEELGAEYYQKVAVLSGPNHAEEVGLGIPSATVIGSENEEVATLLQDVFMAPNFRVYTSQDVVGVELGGALKNIIAIGAGISDGLGFGDNTKSALLTRGLVEIAKLGICMGADPLTFAGLSGLGDLIATCTSKHSRNRKLGTEIAQGRKLDDVLENMGMVVEGVKTTRAARELSLKYEVEMPITEQIYSVLFFNKSPEEALMNLMTRGPKKELMEIEFLRNKYIKK